MHVCTTADLGPDFIAWAGVVHGESIALVSPTTLTNGPARQQALEILRRAGINCGICATPADVTRGEG